MAGYTAAQSLQTRSTRGRSVRLVGIQEKCWPDTNAKSASALRLPDSALESAISSVGFIIFGVLPGIPKDEITSTLGRAGKRLTAVLRGVALLIGCRAPSRA
jgi:hypothetical protein